MPLFLVRRTDPFGTPRDMDAAMFRALVCAGGFPGLKWIRSYLTENASSAYCIFEAESAEDIRAYSEAANIAYDEVVCVDELTPLAYWGQPEEEPAEAAVA